MQENLHPHIKTCLVFQHQNEGLASIDGVMVNGMVNVLRYLLCGAAAGHNYRHPGGAAGQLWCAHLEIISAVCVFG